MATELVDTAELLREDGKYEESIEYYDKALGKSKAFLKAYIGKSIALLKLKQYEESIKVLEKGEEVALRKRDNTGLGLVYFRMFVCYYLQNQLQKSVEFFKKAQKFKYDNDQLQVWKLKLISKSEKSGVKLDFTDKPEIKEAKPEMKQEIKPETNSLPPVKEKLKVDWFQSSQYITITLFIKNIPQDKLDVSYKSNSVSVSFPTSSGSEFQYQINPLFSSIVPGESTYKVYSTKLELILKKDSDIKWKQLESSNDDSPVSRMATTSASTLSYPSSSKKGTNWNNLTLEDEDDDEGQAGDENAFFQSLYKNADDDTKRAMMKSFVESNGTALSTNWEDVSKRKVEVSPPDGLEEKKW